MYYLKEDEYKNNEILYQFYLTIEVGLIPTFANSSIAKFFFFCLWTSLP